MTSPIEQEPLFKRLRKYPFTPLWIMSFLCVLVLGAILYSKPRKEEMQQARTAAVKQVIERCETIPPRECRLVVEGKPMTGTEVFLLLGGLVVAIGVVGGLSVWRDSRRLRRMKKEKQ